MAIPKIIHYCWFGTKDIPDKELECISSWSKFMPEYKIIKWDESNFDINCCKYVKQAYERKKYAFVSDYARMFALYEYGGVYFDTDVEVLGSIDPFLLTTVFLGFENRTHVGTAIMGFEPKNFIVKEMLDFYNIIDFVDKDGNENITTNVTILNNILQKYGLEQENKEQNLINDVKIYNRDVFFPKEISEGNYRITDKTVTIHKMHATWLTDRQRKRGKNKIWINVFRPILKYLRSFLLLLFKENKVSKLEIFVRNLLK